MYGVFIVCNVMYGVIILFNVHTILVLFVQPNLEPRDIVSRGGDINDDHLNLIETIIFNLD